MALSNYGLKVAKGGEAIQALLVAVGGRGGLLLLALGFAIAAVLKIAQGSGTVAVFSRGNMLAFVTTQGTGGWKSTICRWLSWL